MKSLSSRTYRRYIAANVRARRQALNLTQELLSKFIKMDVTTVQRIERGMVNLTVETLVLLAEALEVEPGELFKPAEMKPRKNGRPKRLETEKDCATPKA